MARRDLMAAVADGPVALDTAIFIYWIEDHPRYAGVVAPLFAAADAGRVGLVTSVITLLEVLVKPMRAGDLALAERHEALLTRSRGLTLLDLGRPLVRAAAGLRAVFPSLRTPDAIQMAAALAASARSLLTNDRKLPSVPGLRVLQLSDFV